MWIALLRFNLQLSEEKGYPKLQHVTKTGDYLPFLSIDFTGKRSVILNNKAEHILHTKFSYVYTSYSLYIGSSKAESTRPIDGEFPYTDG